MDERIHAVGIGLLDRREQSLEERLDAGGLLLDARQVLTRVRRVFHVVRAVHRGRDARHLVRDRVAPVGIEAGFVDVVTPGATAAGSRDPSR